MAEIEFPIIEIEFPIIGNSSQTIRYSYSDNEPENGWYYYRLIQVDFDGTTSYSDIVQVYFSSKLEAILYPNPHNQSITKLQLSGHDHVNIDVLDGTGRVVYSQAVSSESGEITLNKAVPAGRLTGVNRHRQRDHLAGTLK